MESPNASTGPRILVPLDGSPLAEQALPYAAALGGEGAELTLLQIIPNGGELPMFLERLAEPLEEVRARYEAASREDVARAARAWLGDRPHVRLEVGIGDPAEQIVRWAAARDVELIAMASHGRGALGRWTFGSVADRVVRAARVPVLVVRPRDAPTEPGVPPAIRRVVVPLDGSALALEALPTAARLASRLALPIHLVRSVPPSESLPPVVVEAPYPTSLYEEMFQAARLDAARTLREAAARLGETGAAVSEEVLPGPAAAAIIDATGPHDVVVLTSHGRTGVRRWLLGSVAEKLVRLGTAPTIVVPAPDRRPSGNQG